VLRGHTHNHLVNIPAFASTLDNEVTCATFKSLSSLLWCPASHDGGCREVVDVVGSKGRRRKGKGDERGLMKYGSSITQESEVGEVHVVILNVLKVK
jgi:hypothetical protein